MQAAAMPRACVEPRQLEYRRVKPVVHALWTELERQMDALPPEVPRGRNVREPARWLASQFKRTPCVSSYVYRRRVDGKPVLRSGTDELLQHRCH